MKEALKFAAKATEEFSHQIINSNRNDFESDAAYEEDCRDKVRMLAISNHNMSIEESFFGNHDKSLEHAKKAYELMRGRYGENNQLTKKFKANYYNKLNADQRPTNSTMTLRGASDRVARRPSNASQTLKPTLGFKLPEWRIKASPYSHNADKSLKFHKKCVPHPEFSQVSASSRTRPLKASSKLMQETGKSNQSRTSSPQLDATKKKNLLSFAAAIQELKELGVTSSGDSSESSGEEKKTIEKNRKAFAKKIESLNPKKAKAEARLKELEKEAPPKEASSEDEAEQRRKQEKQKQEEKAARLKREAEREKLKLEKFMTQYREKNARTLVFQFVAAKARSYKLENNSRLDSPDKGEYLMVLRAIYKVAQINIILATVLIEKKNKLRLLFDVRDLRGYKQPATLYWNTEQVRQAKGDNEVRALAVRVAKKQIKENITWTKETGFRWLKDPPKIEGQASVEPVVLEAKVNDPGSSPVRGKNKLNDSSDSPKVEEKDKQVTKAAPAPVQPEEQKPAEENAGGNFFDDTFDKPQPPADKNPRKDLVQSDSPLNEPVTDNFFDEPFDDIKDEADNKPQLFDPPADAPPAPVSPEQQKASATKIQARVRGFLARKVKPEDRKLIDMDYYGEPNDRYLLCATRVNGKDINVDCFSLRLNKNFKGLVLPSENFSILHVAVNAETESLEYAPPEEPADPPALDKPVDQLAPDTASNKSNDLNTSLVSRKSALFDGKAFTVSAHKYPDEKKIVLRLCEVGKKELLDTEEVKMPADVDIDQINKIASSQLKSSRVGFGQEQQPKIFIDSDVNLFAEAISEAAPEIIRPKGKALYTKQIDDSSRWQILPADETLKLYHFKKTDKDYNWTDFFCLGHPADTKLTPDQCEEILTHFVVDSEGIIECLDEELSFKDSPKHTPRPSKFGNNIARQDTNKDKPLIDLQPEEPDNQNLGEVAAGPEGPEESDSEENQGGDFFAEMRDKEQKHGILPERLIGDGADIVEIVLIKLKNRHPIEIQEVVIPFDEEAEAGHYEQLIADEKMKWEIIEEKPPKLRRVEPDPSTRSSPSTHRRLLRPASARPQLPSQSLRQ